MVFPLLPPLPLVVGSMRHDLQSTAPSADAAATPDFDPSLYPRTYRLATGWWILALAASSAVILGGLVGLGFLATGHWTRDPLVGFLLICLFSAAILCGAYLLADALLSTMTLSPDEIEIADMRPTRRMRRADVRGFSLTRGGLGTLLLIPRDPGRRALKVPLIVTLDAPFRAWFADLPDLDAAERRQWEDGIAAERRLGRTPAERLRRLERARRVAVWLERATIAMAAWVLFFPWPYGFANAVVAALPWAVLLFVAASRGLYRFGGRLFDGHPNVFASFSVPGVMLGLSALRDFEVTGWWAAIAAGIGGSIVLTLLAAIVDPDLRRDWWAGSFLALLMTFYGFGAFLQANAILDRSPMQVIPVVVIDKHLTTGTPTTRNLRLKPWGPYAQPGDVSVVRSLYDAVRSGDSVCIHLRSGALGIPWYVVRSCT